MNICIATRVWSVCTNYRGMKLYDVKDACVTDLYTFKSVKMSCDELLSEIKSGNMAVLNLELRETALFLTHNVTDKSYKREFVKLDENYAAKLGGELYRTEFITDGIYFKIAKYSGLNLIVLLNISTKVMISFGN